MFPATTPAPFCVLFVGLRANDVTRNVQFFGGLLGAVKGRPFWVIPMVISFKLKLETFAFCSFFFFFFWWGSAANLGWFLA